MAIMVGFYCHVICCALGWQGVWCATAECSGRVQRTWAR